VKPVSPVKTAQLAGVQMIVLVMVFAYKNMESINAIAVLVGVVQHATKRLAQTNAPAMGNVLEKLANKNVYAQKASWVKIVVKNIALKVVVAMDYAPKGLACANQDSLVKHAKLVPAQLV
jgi:type IV secretory pathway VirB3-like protein